ncbi:MAG: septum formation initiator family protein [Candidatus Krumholzibacteria bacterium]|nr:septum formation initiator family protein [Candidatus Krumholzibacteria bacterium]
MKSLWGQGTKYLRVKRRSIDISPKAARLLLAIILVLIVVVFIAGDVGLWNLWTAQKRLKDLEGEITELEMENSLLKAEIEQLKINPFAIEKVAREKYGYLRPGDKIYRIITLPTDKESGRIVPSSLDRDH